MPRAAAMRDRAASVRANLGAVAGNRDDVGDGDACAVEFHRHVEAADTDENAADTATAASVTAPVAVRRRVPTSRSAGPRIDRAAMGAHQAVDRCADRGDVGLDGAGIDDGRGAGHRAPAGRRAVPRLQRCPRWGPTGPPSRHGGWPDGFRPWRCRRRSRRRARPSTRTPRWPRPVVQALAGLPR